MINLLLVAALVSTADQPASEQAVVDYCEVAGLALGENKEFVGRVAIRLAEIEAKDRGDFPDAACASKMRESIAVGKSMIEPENYGRYEREFGILISFERRLIDAVIDTMQQR